MESVKTLKKYAKALDIATLAMAFGVLLCFAPAALTSIPGATELWPKAALMGWVTVALMALFAFAEVVAAQYRKPADQHQPERTRPCA
jgi:hypothetical protein